MCLDCYCFCVNKDKLIARIQNIPTSSHLHALLHSAHIIEYWRTSIMFSLHTCLLNLSLLLQYASSCWLRWNGTRTAATRASTQCCSCSFSSSVSSSSLWSKLFDSLESSESVSQLESQSQELKFEWELEYTIATSRGMQINAVATNQTGDPKGHSQKVFI